MLLTFGRWRWSPRSTHCSAKGVVFEGVVIEIKVLESKAEVVQQNIFLVGADISVQGIARTSLDFVIDRVLVLTRALEARPVDVQSRAVPVSIWEAPIGVLGVMDA